MKIDEDFYVPAMFGIIVCSIFLPTILSRLFLLLNAFLFGMICQKVNELEGTK